MLYLALFVTAIVLATLAKRRPGRAQQGGPITSLAQDDDTNSFRVGAYNIHRAKGADGRKDLNRISEVLTGCDLAGLSELEGHNPILRRTQLESLAEKLSLLGVFACAQMRWGFANRGNGALSRFPINHWSVQPLQDSVGKHPRSLLQMEIVIDDQAVAFFVTHLARRVDRSGPAF